MRHEGTPLMDADESPLTRKLVPVWVLTALRFGVFSAVILYAVGLLIVNFDLWRYGIVSLDLTRPEYIMAGTAWAFMTLMTLVSLKFFALRIREKAKRYGKKELIGLIFLPVLGFMVAAGLLFFVFWISEPPRGPWSGAWEVAIVFANAVLLGMIANLLRELLTQDSLSVTVLFSRVDPLRAVTLVGLMLGALWLYSTAVFPYIPRTLGGGTRPLMKIFLTDNPGIPWKDFGVPVSEDGKTIGPVVLLLESPNTLVFRKVEAAKNMKGIPVIRTASAVSLDKRFVAVMVVATDPKDLISGSTRLPSTSGIRAAPE